MEIYAIDASIPVTQQRYEEMMQWVSADKRTKLERFLKREDVLRGLYADVLVRWLACQRLHITNDTLQFVHTEYGKPSLAHSETFHYNVSHSGKWVVCAVDDHPVGIDIEEIRPIDFEVGRICFSNMEYDKLKSLDDDHRLSYFYDLWTLKESFIKAEGQGMSLSLKSFSFVMQEDDRIEVITDGFTTPFRFFRQYDIDPTYKLAVSAAHDSFPAVIQNIHVQQIDLELCHKHFI